MAKRGDDLGVLIGARFMGVTCTRNTAKRLGQIPGHVVPAFSRYGENRMYRPPGQLQRPCRPSLLKANDLAHSELASCHQRILVRQGTRFIRRVLIHVPHYTVVLRCAYFIVTERQERVGRNDRAEQTIAINHTINRKLSQFLLYTSQARDVAHGGLAEQRGTGSRQ